MNDLFGDNNQTNDEKSSSSMSLDGRREQIEDKVNKEMNQTFAEETQGDNRFSGVRLSSPYEANTLGEEKSPYSVNSQNNADIQPKQENIANQLSGEGDALDRGENIGETSELHPNVSYASSPYRQNRNNNYNNNQQPNVPQQYNQQPYAQQPNVYGSPYGGFTTDYTNGAPYYMGKPKKKMNSGLKVFLIVVASLTAIFTVGFVVECAVDYDKSKSDFGSLLDDYGYDDFYDDYDYYDDEDSDDESSDSDSVFAWDQWDDSSDEESNDDSKPEDEQQPKKDIEDAPDSKDVINEKAANIKAEDQPKDIDTGDYTARSAYKKVESSVVSIITYDGEVGNEDDLDGEGSGIIISEDGYIVTNSHVINDTKSIGVEVLTSDDTSYEAVIVGYDSRTDLAVLKIDAEGLTPAEFVNSDQIEVGQDALAVGSPGGVAYSSSLTRGAVSAINRTVSSNALVSYIQTDAAINPGNSGGPLLNIAGQVMGITTIKIVDTEYEGMGFAIPSNTVIEIVNDLISQGYVSNRVRLGITGTAVGSYYYFEDLPSGIQINEFAEGSPFEGTDVKVDDIITAINGEPIEDFTQLYSELDKYQPGDEVTVTIFREGAKEETFDVKITLVADNGETQD